MIEIYITRKENLITEVLVSGHSKDFLCNSVSAITQTALFGLLNVCKPLEEAVESFIEEEDGVFYMYISPDIHYHYRSKCDVILDTMLLGLNSINNDYPDEVAIIWR